MTVTLFLRKIIYYVVAVLFSVSSILAFLCVIFRYVFNNSIVWGEELIRILFIWMFMLGAAEAFRRKKHLTLDIFLNVLPKNTKRVVQIFIYAVLLCFLIIFVYLGIKNCLIHAGGKTVALGFSYGIVYACFPLGGVLMIYFIALNLVELVKNKEPAGG